MKRSVFIQANDKQLLAARVAAYAVRRNSRGSEEFDVQFVRVEDFPSLYGRAGERYLREGKPAIWSNDDLQSFTPTRFLPPQLMGFEGRAVVIDPDVFAIADIMQLFELDTRGKAILCRRIVPAGGGPPYWATSVMVLDCAKLGHWRWDESIEEMFAFRRDYRDWMSLKLEQQETIGVLADEWNHYDILTKETKILHNTGRLTQPWKTGLPIDFSEMKNSGAPMEGSWKVLARALLRRLKCAARGDRYFPDGYYQPHPDPKQEEHFISLLRECVRNGSIGVEEIRREMAKKHLRRDLLELLNA